MARTLVINTSGGDKHFGFPPPHGVDMAEDEELVIDGDLLTILAGGLNRFSRRTEISALEEAVAAGEISVDNLLDSSSSSGP